MARTNQNRLVNPDDEVTRLKDRREAALAAGRLAAVAEITRQLDELYAEIGSARVYAGQAPDRRGQR
jgi:hypothetical protein